MREIADRVTYLMWKSYRHITPSELFDGYWQVTFFFFFFFFLEGQGTSFYSFCFSISSKRQPKQGKNREKEAPNIHKLGVIFNHLSSLCSVAILNTQEEEPRLQILIQVIELGTRLKKVRENEKVMGSKRGEKEGKDCI